MSGSPGDDDVLELPADADLGPAEILATDPLPLGPDPVELPAATDPLFDPADATLFTTPAPDTAFGTAEDVQLTPLTGPVEPEPDLTIPADQPPQPAGPTEPLPDPAAAAPFLPPTTDTPTEQVEAPDPASTPPDPDPTDPLLDPADAAPLLPPTDTPAEPVEERREWSYDEESSEDQQLFDYLWSLTEGDGAKPGHGRPDPPVGNERAAAVRRVPGRPRCVGSRPRGGARGGVGRRFPELGAGTRRLPARPRR